MKIKRLLHRLLPAFILLAAWTVSMSYITVAGARKLYRDWQRMSWDFNKVSCYSETQRVAGEQDAEFEKVAHLEIPMFGQMSNWYTEPIRHVEVSHYYLDEQGKTTIPEGNYAVLHYYSEAEWLKSWWDCTENECYLDLDTVPQEFYNWLKANLVDQQQKNQAPWVALHGSFEGERFVPVKARWIDRFADIKKDEQWNVIFDRSEGVPQPEVLIIRGWTAYGLSDVPFLFVNTVTEPMSVGDLNFDSGQTLAEAWAESEEALINAYIGNDLSEIPYFRQLREMVFISQAFELQQIGPSGPEDVNFTSCAQIIRCYPLRSAVFQLLPVYILSLLGVIVIFLLVRRYYGKSILSTLSRGEGRDTQMQPGSHGWKTLARLEEQYEETAARLRVQTPELLRMENALRYAGDAEENRRKLVSDMTHELKTPLAVIHSYAEGLIEGIAPEKQESYLRIIMEEAEKMDSMVLSMLDLSRLEAGRVHLDREPVCLMEMAKTVFGKLRPMYEKKKLRIHFFGESFDVLADRSRMEQMITNLASNAIKYCLPAGDIFIKAHHLGDRTWFSMENDCYRLPQKSLDQIWDSFFREDSVRTIQGTGLGLPIVKAIVELHGGSCRAVNTDSGVEFQINLPG